MVNLSTNKRAIKRFETLEEDLWAIHGKLYDYSLVQYSGMTKKVEIICRLHGVFKQTLANHIKGRGCPICGKEISDNKNRSSTKEFIKKAKKIHGKLYNYSKVTYEGVHKSIQIICPTHGVFKQTPNSHLQGQGCPACGRIKMVTEEFIKKAKELHGSRYDYSAVNYIGTSTPIDIRCALHGTFKQTPNNHLQGCGCPLCNDIKYDKDEFIRRAEKIHGSLYDYSDIDYTGAINKISILCRQHGAFEQRPSNHIYGHGCPVCIHHISVMERSLTQYIRDLEVEVIISDRSLIKPYELDIYLPEYKLAIEYDGVYWHTEQKGKYKNYHLNKTKLCEKQGVQLLHIFSTDDIDIWKSVISAKIGKVASIGARQTIIHEVDAAIAREFLEKNHLQGSINGIHMGLHFQDELISLSTWGKSRFNKNYENELLRFCTKRGHRVIGAASKLLTGFRRMYKGSIISYANRRWSNGDLYVKLGFELLHTSPPNYFYTKDHLELFSRNKFQKHKLEAQLGQFDPALTEVQNMTLNGYNRIFDCGNLVYVL